MSEPVSNSEIEDVLSSIRRLIAESPGNGEQGRTSRPGAPDKLVLTPAFRVLEPEKAETEAAQATEAQAEATQAEAAQQSSAGTGAADAGVAPEEATDETAGKTPAEGPSELEQRIAELEAAIGESYEEWEPDGSEFEESPAAATMPHPAPEAAMQWQDAPEPYDPATDETSAAIMILEAEEITDEEESEEDESGEGSTGDSDDAAQQSAVQTGGSDASDKDESGGNATADEEDILIDEEALRELVAQLVREQLRGQIGERITRSIRRMVRREIRLALAVRDTE